MCCCRETQKVRPTKISSILVRLATNDIICCWWQSGHAQISITASRLYAVIWLGLGLAQWCWPLNHQILTSSPLKPSRLLRTTQNHNASGINVKQISTLLVSDKKGEGEVKGLTRGSLLSEHNKSEYFTWLDWFKNKNLAMKTNPWCGEISVNTRQ